jgi:two-component system response regulator HupR/HoxA
MTALPCILIVDDEKRSLETLERILEDHFTIFTAINATEAAAILEREWIQVILCDQLMPDTTGVEFLKRVREQWPDVIRMIISGYSHSEDIISAVNEVGIYQYITKPWQPDSLILTLKNAAELFHLQRQNQLLALELKMTPQHLAQDMRQKRDQRRHYEPGQHRSRPRQLHECDLRQTAAERPTTFRCC